MPIGFIGAGRMAQALSRGIISKGKLKFSLYACKIIHRVVLVGSADRGSLSISTRLDLVSISRAMSRAPIFQQFSVNNKIPKIKTNFLRIKRFNSFYNNLIISRGSRIVNI